MRRLSRATLDEASPSVRRPAYDIDALRVGHMHIGVGAFHRCHQAEFIDDMLEARFGPWGVIGVNLQPPRLESGLGAQDGLYTRTLRQDDKAETRVIGALRGWIDADGVAGAASAISALASPTIGVVTMTVTEKGYSLTPSTGALDLNLPEVVADLAGANPPRTLLGLLARGLARRRATVAKPLTLLSCDNIPANGRRLKSGLIAYAGERSPDLARWIEAHVAFPCAMVDRIVPAATAADREDASERLSLSDEAAVVGEPFRQWVIEEHFAGERPPWDLAGAQFVADAEPYEHIKMRVLNAAQSTLSHWGALVGHEFSHQAASDPLLAGLVVAMLEDETASTLPKVTDMAVARYIATSMARIRNTAIQHRCHQIGTDGSQKIAQRLLAPLRARLASDRPAPLLTLAVAGWIAYVSSGARRFGARWAPSDPWGPAIIELGEREPDFAALAASILSIKDIFGGDLARPALVRAIATHLQGLLVGDPREWLAKSRARG
jgi:fructuronate reductase